MSGVKFVVILSQGFWNHVIVERVFIQELIKILKSSFWHILSQSPCWDSWKLKESPAWGLVKFWANHITCTQIGDLSHNLNLRIFKNCSHGHKDTEKFFYFCVTRFSTIEVEFIMKFAS